MDDISCPCAVLGKGRQMTPLRFPHSARRDEDVDLNEQPWQRLSARRPALGTWESERFMAAVNYR